MGENFYDQGTEETRMKMYCCSALLCSAMQHAVLFTLKKIEFLGSAFTMFLQ
jgi:hypothetical protein